MILTVDGQIRIKDAPERLAEALRTKLTVDNPAYINALRLGAPTYSIPRKIMLYQIIDNELIVPRGLWMDVWRSRPSGTVQRNFTVRRPAVDFPRQTIVLRDYQTCVLDAIEQQHTPQGVIVMPCGAGKTETAMALIAKLRQPALWITHTKDLVQQAVDRAESRLGLVPGELGVIGGGRNTIGTHLTVATVQTLYNRDLDDLAASVGCVIVDECHRVVNNPENASMFARVLAHLPAHYRFGITASEFRADGLIGTMYHILGDKLAEVSQDELNAKGNVVVPIVQPIVTQYEYTPASGEDTVNFARFRRHLAADRDRHDAVMAYLTDELLYEHSCLVLADNLALLEQVHTDLLERGISAAYICGATKQHERAAALSDLRAGKVRALCATYQLAKEGLDIPRADRLFLASPVKNPAAVQQSLGRIMRPAEGKTDAVVYDFIDRRVGMCKAQYSQRKKVYQKLNCKIEKEIIL